MARTTPAASSTNRLGAQDWIRAGFEILAEEGIAGVKIQPLCRRLGVTKGSFYWHFTDIDTFHGELARTWAADGPRLPGVIEDGIDPQARLMKAMSVFADARNRNLIRAMRDWAQTDERARAAITKADRDVFEQVTAAIEALGFSGEEAEVRAKSLYYAGVGFAHVGPLDSRLSAQEQLTATWELLTRI